MRLRRKPWIDEAIKDYTDILYMEEPTRLKGKWNTLFPEPENPIHVEFGTGKGRFISSRTSFHNTSGNRRWSLLPPSPDYSNTTRWS